jgi:hypothetical protein
MDPVLFEKMSNDRTGAYGMPAYYDRGGNRISLLRQCELAGDPNYKILRRTVVPKGTVISAWLGEDQVETPEGEAPSIYGTILQHNDGDFDHSVEGFSKSSDECLDYHEILVGVLSL